MTIYQQHPDLLTFQVDMNSLRGDQLGTLLSHATDPFIASLYPPAVDDEVLVEDEDGVRYRGIVDEISGSWLGLRIVWESRTVLPYQRFGKCAFAGFQTKPETAPDLVPV